MEYEEGEEPDVRMSLDTDSPKSETGVSVRNKSYPLHNILTW